MIAGARLAGLHARDELAPLLFVHGVGSTAAIWDRQLEAFGVERLCAAIELRGNGARKPDPDPATITRSGYADDVLAVADALGARRFTLVGCSLGGVVAFELWRRAPHRLGAMLVLGSFARYPDGAAYAEAIVTEVRACEEMRVFGERRARKLGLPPERLHETIEQFACKSIECFAAATLATWTGDYLDLLPSIDVPALVAYGQRDAVAPQPLAQEIAAGIRGCELVMIPDAGHVANADQPAAFDALLRSFVERTG
jgi:3-oxoadipate enol-lactonase